VWPSTWRKITSFVVRAGWGRLFFFPRESTWPVLLLRPEGEGKVGRVEHRGEWQGAHKCPVTVPALYGPGNGREKGFFFFRAFSVLGCGCPKNDEKKTKNRGYKIPMVGKHTAVGGSFCQTKNLAFPRALAGLGDI